jgi:hypothetical protein
MQVRWRGATLVITAHTYTVRIDLGRDCSSHRNTKNWHRNIRSGFGCDGGTFLVAGVIVLDDLIQDAVLLGRRSDPVGKPIDLILLIFERDQDRTFKRFISAAVVESCAIGSMLPANPCMVSTPT